MHLLKYRDRHIELPLGQSVQGRFRCVVRDAATEDVVRDTGWFSNIITNSGLDYIGSGATGPIAGNLFYQYFYIGTGTSTPLATDTTLQSLSAQTTLGASGVPGNSVGPAPDYIASAYAGKRFAAGTLNGNYSEIGIGPGPSPTYPIFARALIVDGGGSPTTISVTSTQILDVYYEVRTIPVLTDTTGTITITGVGTRNFTGRVSQIGASYHAFRWEQFRSASNDIGWIPALYTGSMGTILTTPSGAISSIFGNYSRTQGSYTPGTYSNTITHSWGVDNGAGAVKSVLVGSNWGGWQAEFDTTFNKTTNDAVSFTFNVTWNRA